MLRSELGEAEPAERAELEQVVMPAAAAASRRDRRRRRAGGGAGRSRAPDTARRRPRLPGPGPASRGQARRRPRRGRAAGKRRRGRSACSRSASREGIAVVPFGGGTSVVGGVEPLRGGFERLISLDLRRLRDVVRRPTLADGGAGPRASRPGGRGGPERAGGDAGALPAVVRVRDDRRLRRHPLRRPGVERLWALRRAGHVDRPHRAGGRSAHARDPAQRRRPGAARARRRLRGSAGGDHRGDRAGSARFRSAAATRRGWRPTSPPEPRWCARSPRPTRSRTWCGSPTRPRRDSRWRSRGRPGPSAPCSRATCGCAAARRAA